MNKRMLYSAFTLLLIASFFLPQGSVQATTVGAENIITDISIKFNGTRPASALMYDLSEDGPQPITINAEKFTQTVVLSSDSFSATDLAPDDLKASGVTRTFSSTYAGYVTSSESERGIWNTLEFIDENSFSQYDIEQDIDVYALTPTEPFTDTITRFMSAIDATWTYENFTVSSALAYISFDKTAIDNFLLDAKAKDNYATVASQYSTDNQKIITLLDDVFDNHILDIVYSIVNETDYTTGWTVSEEVEAVLGGNATDTSLDGATEIGSIRNLIYGYIGNIIAPDSVVKTAVEPNPIERSGRIVGLLATETTYVIKFDLFTDLVSGSKVKALFDTVFTTIFPHIEVAGTVVLVWWGNLIVGAIFGVIAGLIGYFATKKKKLKWKKAGLAFLFTFLIVTALMFLFYGGFF